MAKIYLRMPTYVAQFYRGRETDHPLTEFQPVEFSPFQTEHVMMSSWLVLVNESESDNTVCFSERMWKNILSGRKPQGGKVLIKRDPQQWPTMDEINLLTGVPRDKRSDGYDYLCIEAPRTILVGRRYKQVTTSFTLPQSAANEMAKTMRLEFIRVMVKFIKDELSYCDIKGIEREITMCVDHFFFHYNICLGTNMKDRDTMRRMAARWLEDAKVLVKDITSDDVLFLYEKECENMGRSLDDLTRNI